MVVKGVLMSEIHTMEFWSTRKNKADPFTFVGDFDRLFYNPVTKSIRISDGTTPGGLPIAGGGSSAEAIYSNITPPATPNGLMWFNPDTDILSIASDNIWVAIGGGGAPNAIALYTNVAPVASPNGLMWFNPDNSELSIASAGIWVPVTGTQGATGPEGATGPTGATGAIVPYIFDGGTPFSTYYVGPAFDCGGVT